MSLSYRFAREQERLIVVRTFLNAIHVFLVQLNLVNLFDLNNVV
jgi:hypothetical protein